MSPPLRGPSREACFDVRARSDSRPTARAVIGRGLRRRCPRCGRGPLFDGFLRVHRQCAVCGLALASRPGDTWGFWVLGDRLFIVIPVVLIYFGVAPLSVLWRTVFMVSILIPLVLTMPHRLGVCIGFDYWTRVHWGDWDGSSEAPTQHDGPPGG